MTFSELLHNLTARYTQAAVAREIGIDAPSMSLICRGDKGLKKEQLDKLFEMAGVVVLEKKQYAELLTTIRTTARMITIPED